MPLSEVKPITEISTTLSQAESEQELTRRAQRGCALAFEELARRYQPRLLVVLERRFSGRFSDAEDVAQEALACAWQKISMYNAEYRFSTWLFTIAVRLATDHQRRERRRSTDIAMVAEPVDPNSAELSVQQKDETDNLWLLANDVLGDTQYTALWLRYGEDLELSEVAQVMGKTRVGARVTIHRARKRLQRHMKSRTHLDDAPGGES